MFVTERHERIIQLLAERGRLESRALPRLLRCSPATLRRDLIQLEAAGRVVRTHGGIMRTPANGAEADFARKARTATAAKQAIARRAAALVPPHSTVFVDAGTSALEAGRQLLARSDLTLYTNSLPLLNLRVPGQARLIAVGGELREISCALVGGLALEWLQHLRFDCAIVGASGLDTNDGASTTELTEAQVKKAFVARARRVLLVADQSKWQQPAPVAFAAWDQVHDWITDYRATRAEAHRLQARDVTLHVVTPD